MAKGKGRTVQKKVRKQLCIKSARAQVASFINMVSETLFRYYFLEFFTTFLLKTYHVESLNRSKNH